MPGLPAEFRLVIAGGVHPKDRMGHEYWSELLARIDEVGCHDRVVFTAFWMILQSRLLFLTGGCVCSSV